MAILGAGFLSFFYRLPPLLNYTIAGPDFEVPTVNTVIGCLIVLLALLEMSPRFQGLAFSPRWLPHCGAISGFFGGKVSHTIIGTALHKRM